MTVEQQKPLNSGFGIKSEPSEVLAGIDLKGKVAVVTGGYSGIGIETVRALHGVGARVLVPARRVDVAREALKGIVAEGDVVELDLASVSSARACAASIVSKVDKIDILINNAAVMACPETRVGDGWEKQFAANHLGHFALTLGLIPALKKSGNARVVVLSSCGHKIKGMQWDDIHFTKKYEKWAAYGQSKTACSLFAVGLDQHMKDSGIRAFAVHPGGIMTALQRNLDVKEMQELGWLGADGKLSPEASAGFKTTTGGATTSLWCATSPKLDGMGGVYCEDCDISPMTEEGAAHARYFGVNEWAIDGKDAERLWKVSEEALNSEK